MLPTFLGFFVALLCLGLSSGQSSRLEWAPEDMYHPGGQSLECGMPTKSPAYVCDPNGILGEDIGHVDWMLQEIATNATNCPCSTYYCEHSSGPKGYIVGVALVKKMKLEKNTKDEPISPADQAQLFAYILESDMWQMGDCEEDIVVFYSVDDKILVIATGETAGKKLTKHYRDLIIRKVGTRLDEGKIVEALNNIILDIRFVLNCNAENVYDCDLYNFTGSRVGRAMASFTVTFFCVFVALRDYW